MLKVEVLLGIVASSLAILAFFARAIANIRRGKREKELRRRREITPPE